MTFSRILICAQLLLGHGVALHATTYNITSAGDFDDLPSTLQAGDIVTIQDGTYNEVNETLTAAGTAANPVRLYAVNPGNVFFSGETRFTLKGSNMLISGLSFDGDTAPGAPAYSSGLFRFERDSSDFILRDCMFRNFNTGADESGDYWIQMHGYRHTVEYCSFIGKDSEDPVINIIPIEGEDDLLTKDIPRQHLFRFCYFGERTNIGENGYETIRIGESKYQMYDMSTVVEYCLFERAIYGPNISNYEPEVISSKSRNNIYRYNTFVENKGGLVLRHGDDNIVEGNFFFGIPKPAEPETPPEGEIALEEMGAGIRIIGLRHIIRNNYFEDIHGIGLRAPICLMKGSGEFGEDSTSNGYESPGNARIFHNTIVGCEQPFALGPTTSSSGTTPPKNVEIRNNVVQSNADNGEVIDFNSDNGWSISQITFSGNQAYHPSGTYGTVPASGFETGTPVNLAQDVALGYQIPQAGSPVINAASALATTPETVSDIRSMIRTGPPHDAGSFDTEGTATSFNKPLAKTDVGPVFDGRTDPNRVPSLLEQPSGSTVFEGDPVSFSVIAESPQAMTYQWTKDDVAISGATSDSYSVGAAELDDAGSYSVVVTNASGRAISSPVTLVVDLAGASIVTQPTSRLAGIGGSATFTVEVEGIAPFSYQWRKGTEHLPEETNATLVLTGVQESDAGEYSVVVTNAHGSDTSEAATLSVSTGTIIVNDDFSDVDRAMTGSLDANWWSSSSDSSSPNSIEIDDSGLGLVTGTSGRGIHATFAAQTLEVGERLSATFAFTTPATIGTDKGGAFKVAIVDFNDAGLADDLKSSSSSVNPLYTDLPGYMADFDIGTGTENISIYEHDTPNTSGRFLGTSGEWTAIGESDGGSYAFAAESSYVGVISVTRTGEDALDIFTSLSEGATLLHSHTETDVSGIANHFGMLGFWANSNTFGSTSSKGVGSDNGVTFTNVTVIREPVSTLSALENWRFTHFETTENAGDAANDFDFDFDGLENLVEYFLGLDPTIFDSDGATTFGTMDIDGSDYLTLTFARDLNATGVTATVLAGSNLPPTEMIDPYGANQVSSDIQGSVETLTVRDNVPTSDVDRRFMSLEVTEP